MHPTHCSYVKKICKFQVHFQNNADMVQFTCPTSCLMFFLFYHWYQIFYKLYHLVKKKKIWSFTSYKKSSLDFTTNSITINASCLPNKVTKIPQKLQAASDCQPNGIRILIILQKAACIHQSHLSNNKYLDTQIQLNTLKSLKLETFNRRKINANRILFDS